MATNINCSIDTNIILLHVDVTTVHLIKLSILRNIDRNMNFETGTTTNTQLMHRSAHTKIILFALRLRIPQRNLDLDY